MKAIKDRIIVKLEQPQKQLIYTDSRQYSDRGTVVEVGENVHSVKIGEQIIFHSFDEIPLPEKGLAVIREKSVLAILDN